MNDLLRSSGLTMMPNDKDMAQVDKAIEWVTKNPKSEQERRVVGCRRRFWQGKRMVAAMAKNRRCNAEPKTAKRQAIFPTILQAALKMDGAKRER